ncbi:MAG: hypothetical protein R3C56_28775 [Pirellulaceae bacterium]
MERRHRGIVAKRPVLRPLPENQRFRISSEFAVQEILGDDVTGSLVNMAFNEFGHIIAAQERGPLLLLYDSDKDGMVDKKREYCDLVQGFKASCHSTAMCLSRA